MCYCRFSGPLSLVERRLDWSSGGRGQLCHCQLDRSHYRCGGLVRYKFSKLLRYLAQTTTAPNVERWWMRNLIISLHQITNRYKNNFRTCITILSSIIEVSLILSRVKCRKNRHLLSVLALLLIASALVVLRYVRQSRKLHGKYNPAREGTFTFQKFVDFLKLLVARKFS